MESTVPFEEFKEYFWEYIPESLVSDLDISNNQDWADSVVYETWRLNQYSGIDRAVLLKLVENIFFSFRRYSPIFIDEL